MNTKSKIIPLLETVFLNKGGEADQWKAILKIVKERTDE